MALCDSDDDRPPDGLELEPPRPELNDLVPSGYRPHAGPPRKNLSSISLALGLTGWAGFLAAIGAPDQLRWAALSVHLFPIGTALALLARDNCFVAKLANYSGVILLLFGLYFSGVPL